MEDGAKENTALNIQKPLEILVTDEDKHGTDIACMSDFFGIYIEQLSAELSNQVMRGVVEKIPAADVQILGELVHGVDVLLSGKYGYIPDFDSLPNDVTPAAAAAALGIGIGAKFFIKNGGKIVKNALKILNK